MDAVFLTLAEAIDGGALQASALWALRSIPGFPPIIQTVHILGIAAIMGSVVMINLRMLGLALPSQQLFEMNTRLVPWLWWALLANAVSGGFFLFARPFRYLDNPLLETDVYPLAFVPVDIRWQDFATTSAIAMALSVLASIVPALRAASLPVAETLAH